MRGSLCPLARIRSCRGGLWGAEFRGRLMVMRRAADHRYRLRCFLLSMALEVESGGER